MPRRAPAVERAIAILNLLAAHPTERFTLSEIARDLDLNKATLHAILWALVEAGYLIRDPDQKTYGIGPALIALGNAATASSPAVDAALPEMRAITDDLGLDCVASAAIHDEIVILARTGTPGPFGLNIQPGMRLPLVPPLGTVFVAWSDQRAIDRYLARVEPEKGELDRYRGAVDAVRERGYSIGIARGAYRRLVEALKEAGHAAMEEGVKGLQEDEYALVELEAQGSYRLNHIGAPVFAPDGGVTLALFLIGFQDQLPAEQIPRYADRLREAAGRVTKSIQGREPGAP
ncbi:MAG: IclR family transcriptional regulator [Actinomycetota bacterium]